MTGIQFITDAKGRKTAAVIDLKKHSALWEDIPVSYTHLTLPTNREV